MPPDEPIILEDEERAAWSIIMMQFEGNRLNWDSGEWEKRGG